MHALSFLALASLAAPAAAQDLAPFDASTLMAGDQERFVKTADLDGDGKTDAIGWWRTSSSTSNPAIHTLSGYHNDGTGKLSRVWTQEFASPSLQWSSTFDPHESCVVADLDADGDDDFVISAGSRIDVWLSNGVNAPTLAIAEVNTLPDVWRSIALADFDLDGDLDLAAVRGTSVEVHDIDLTGGALVLRSTRVGAWNFGRLLAVEMTGDATPDLVSDGRIVFPVLDAQIQAPTTYPEMWTVDFGYELRHDSGDIDGDGDVDIVTFRKHVSQPLTSYRILRRTGRSSFTMQGPFSGGPARRLFDIDGDGDLDGVCCGGGGGNGLIYNTQISSFRIALNDGTGAFAPALEVLGLGSTAIAGVADMDGDGRVDLVAGRTVYFQRQAMRQAAQPVVASRDRLDLALGDVDGDGDIDLEPLPWSVRTNRGDGRVALGPIPTPPPPAGHERSGQGYQGDWDGDGDLDMLVNLNSGGAIVGMELLVHRGNGTYTSAGTVATDAGGLTFSQFVDDGFAADVDGDGDQDLVKRNLDAGGVSRRTSWWRNDGAAFTRVATWEGQVVIEVTDYDGDGRVDLLGSGPAFALYLARGLGAGDFAAFELLASVDTGTNLNAVAGGDLDADGDRDIVCIHRLTLGMAHRLLRNDGSGHFTIEDFSALIEAAVSSFAPSVRIFDIDEDGHLDVVAAPARAEYRGAVILRGSASGNGWQEPIVQMILHPVPNAQVPEFPRLGAADLDGDGDIDLLTNRLIQNTRNHGEPRGLHVQIGTSTLGEGGVRPLLGGHGPFQVGQPARIVLRGARPAASGVMTVSYAEGLPADALGGLVAQHPSRIQAQVHFTTTGTALDPAGSGTWDLPYTVPNYVAGRTTLYMVDVDDPTTIAGSARSNRLFVQYGL